jgi:hypothetical protein
MEKIHAERCRENAPVLKKSKLGPVFNVLRLVPPSTYDSCSDDLSLKINETETHKLVFPVKLVSLSSTSQNKNYAAKTSLKKFEDFIRNLIDAPRCQRMVQMKICRKL